MRHREVLQTMIDDDDASEQNSTLLIICGPLVCAASYSFSFVKRTCSNLPILIRNLPASFYDEAQSDVLKKGSGDAFPTSSTCMCVSL